VDLESTGGPRLRLTHRMTNWFAKAVPGERRRASSL
jgi:hypothetical protein